MKLHLDFKVPKFVFEINHQSKVMLMGSCFSENIGAYLLDRKFKVSISPLGILFNPISIHQSLEGIIQQKKIEKKFLLQREEKYFSFLHHSQFNSDSEEDLQNLINNETHNANTFLKDCDFLFITLGTSFYYFHKELTETVANCHKQPQQIFEKKLTNVAGVVKMYSELIEQLKKFNPNLKIIFTVSPVKHLRDGLIENNLSKSILLLSVNEICKQNENCFYYPAFELVNDDLRDYRFYKDDMAHPNEQAIQYVWQKFSESLFSQDAKAINFEIEKLNSLLNHKKRTNNSEQELNFIKTQIKKIKSLNPNIKFSIE